jgi:hypothetical protein
MLLRKIGIIDIEGYMNRRSHNPWRPTHDVFNSKNRAMKYKMIRPGPKRGANNPWVLNFDFENLSLEELNKPILLKKSFQGGIFSVLHSSPEQADFL